LRLALRSLRGLRLGGGFGLGDPLLFEEPFLRRSDRRGDSLAHELSGLGVEDAEIGPNVSPHAVEQLDDQSALNLQFLGELIHPQLRHADS
jgi:hypothetical protein